MQTGQNSSPLKPPLPLLLCTGIILASTILLIASALSMFAATGDLCSFMACFMILPLISCLALWQYRAVFHAEHSAASRAANFLFVIAALVTFGFVRTLYEMVLARVLWSFSLLLPMFSIGLFALITGYLDFLWSQKLKPAEFSQVASNLPRRFTIRDKLAMAIATLSTILLTIYFITFTTPQYAENVTPDKSPIRLPSTAANVSFCQGQRGTFACEFKVDEPTFITWVDSGIGSLESQAARIPVKPITTPLTINRYPFLLPSLKGDQSITVKEGLYYSWSNEDRGVQAIFDRTTNCAFYFAHYH